MSRRLPGCYRHRTVGFQERCELCAESRRSKISERIAAVKSDDGSGFAVDVYVRELRWHNRKADEAWRNQVHRRLELHRRAWHVADAGAIAEWRALEDKHFSGRCFHCDIELRDDVFVYPEPEYRAAGRVPVLHAAVIQQCCVACLSSSLSWQNFRMNRALSVVWRGRTVGSWAFEEEPRSRD